MLGKRVSCLGCSIGAHAAGSTRLRTGMGEQSVSPSLRRAATVPRWAERTERLADLPALNACAQQNESARKQGGEGQRQRQRQGAGHSIGGNEHKALGHLRTQARVSDEAYESAGGKVEQVTGAPSRSRPLPRAGGGWGGGEGESVVKETGVAAAAYFGVCHCQHHGQAVSTCVTQGQERAKAGAVLTHSPRSAHKAKKVAVRPPDWWYARKAEREAEREGHGRKTQAGTGGFNLTDGGETSPDARSGSLRSGVPPRQLRARAANREHAVGRIGNGRAEGYQRTGMVGGNEHKAALRHLCARGRGECELRSGGWVTVWQVVWMLVRTVDTLFRQVAANKSHNVSESVSKCGHEGIERSTHVDV